MNPLPPERLPAPHIHALLTQLGLTYNYTGFYHTAAALELALREPQALCLVTKGIYPAVGRYCHTSAFAVEKSIRLSVARIWKAAPQKLSELSGVPLTKRPSNAVFLSILYSYLADRPSG